MKIKCIDEDGWVYLTNGKNYEVLNKTVCSNTSYYYLIDNNGRENWYETKCFKPLSEARNEKIDKLLNDDVTNES